MAKDKTFWISFSNGHSLGICIVDAPDAKAAHLKTIQLGINPGGELMIVEFDNSPDAKKEIKKWGKNRLVSREELVADKYIPTDQLTEDVQNRIAASSRVTKVCEDCNNGTCRVH